MQSILVKLCALLLALSAVSAFAPPLSQFGVTRVSTLRPMFSGDEPGPLTEVEKGKDASPEVAPLESAADAPTSFAQNLGSGGEIKEVKWVDPAMSANTNPFNMDAWAYVLFGFPIILLANDLFHFIPESFREGPLGFLL